MIHHSVDNNIIDTHSVNNHSIDCLGVVLAGGLSSRMGQDKSQLRRAQNVLIK